MVNKHPTRTKILGWPQLKLKKMIDTVYYMASNILINDEIKMPELNINDLHIL